jgi:hypothetical protein
MRDLIVERSGLARVKIGSLVIGLSPPFCLGVGNFSALRWYLDYGLRYGLSWKSN